jgi:histidinol-phosphate aminotransferase
MTTAAPRSGLSRLSYETLDLYAPDRGPAAIDLSDNTNRWGMPPAAERALRDVPVESVTRYPELYAESLKQALAHYVGSSAGEIVTGCGSDDVLDSAIRAFGEPGEIVALPDPSFPMIPRFATMNGLRSVAVPLAADYALAADAMLAVDPRIVYICAPNNPTGTATALSVIEDVARRVNGVVIVDEAYAEFSDANALALTRRLENVLVVRTLSKAFGLAGLRVGYAVGAPRLVREVEKSRGPYKVGALAAAAAVAALRAGRDWVDTHVALAIANRERLCVELAGRGYGPVPSRTNFVFVPIAGADAIATGMRERGVAVRALAGITQVSDALRASAGSALRISVGPWPQLAIALDALDDARRACA